MAVGFADASHARRQVGQVQEWNLQTGASLAPPLALAHGPASDVSFAPTGTTVATLGPSGWVDVVDPAHGRNLLDFKTSGTNTTPAVEFSPSGTEIAAGDFDGYLRLWDAKSGKPVSPVVDASSISGVAWSPDGSTILTSGLDGAARLYGPASLTQIGAAMPVSQGGIVWGTFSSDGSEVVLTNTAGRVWIYPADLTQLQIDACRLANANLTAAQWQQELPDSPYQQTCPTNQ